MPKTALTLEQIKEMDTEMLTPDIVSRVIGCDPNYIRVAAVDCPEVLGFRVCRIGNRTKIPRRAFVAFMEGTT